MSSILFLLSAFLFQLPFGIYQHTARKLKVMKSHNPGNAFNYELENGKLKDNITLSAIVFISGLGLSLIPILIDFNFHWVTLFFANILFLYFITPFIAFLIYPKKAIYTQRILFLKSILMIGLGALFLILAISTK